MQAVIKMFVTRRFRSKGVTLENKQIMAFVHHRYSEFATDGNSVCHKNSGFKPSQQSPFVINFAKRNTS